MHTATYSPTGRIIFGPAPPPARRKLAPSLAQVHALLAQAVEMLRALGQPGATATQDQAWQQILALTAKEFRCSEADITTTARTQRAAHCRGVVNLLATRYLHLTGSQLDARWGKALGTSHHAMRVVSNRIETEPAFRSSVARIEGCLIALCQFTPVP